jgi:hypothetical protein
MTYDWEVDWDSPVSPPVITRILATHHSPDDPDDSLSLRPHVSSHFPVPTLNDPPDRF